MYDVPKRPDTIGQTIKGLKHPKKCIQWKTNSKRIYVGSHYVIKKNKTFKQI